MYLFKPWQRVVALGVWIIYLWSKISVEPIDLSSDNFFRPIPELLIAFALVIWLIQIKKIGWKREVQKWILTTTLSGIIMLLFFQLDALHGLTSDFSNFEGMSLEVAQNSLLVRRFIFSEVAVYRIARMVLFSGFWITFYITTNHTLKNYD